MRILLPLSLCFLVAHAQANPGLSDSEVRRRSAEVSANTAIERIKANDVDGGITHLKKAIAADPTYVDPFLTLARLTKKEGDAAAKPERKLHSYRLALASFDRYLREKAHDKDASRERSELADLISSVQKAQTLAAAPSAPPTNEVEKTLSVGEIDVLDFDFDNPVAMQSNAAILYLEKPGSRQLRVSPVRSGSSELTVANSKGEVAARIRYRIVSSAEGDLLASQLASFPEEPESGADVAGKSLTAQRVSFLLGCNVLKAEPSCEPLGAEFLRILLSWEFAMTGLQGNPGEAEGRQRARSSRDAASLIGKLLRGAFSELKVARAQHGELLKSYAKELEEKPLPTERERTEAAALLRREQAKLSRVRELLAFWEPGAEAIQRGLEKTAACWERAPAACKSGARNVAELSALGCDGKGCDRAGLERARKEARLVWRNACAHLEGRNDCGSLLEEIQRLQSEWGPALAEFQQEKSSAASESQKSAADDSTLHFVRDRVRKLELWEKKLDPLLTEVDARLEKLKEPVRLPAMTMDASDPIVRVVRDATNSFLSGREASRVALAEFRQGADAFMADANWRLQARREFLGCMEQALAAKSDGFRICRVPR